MAPTHELHDGSEDLRPTKYRMGSDGSPIAVTDINTNLSPSSATEVEIDTLLKKAPLLLVVDGIPLEYKGKSITMAEAEELRCNDSEYRILLVEAEKQRHNNNMPLLRNREVLHMIMKLVVIPDKPLEVGQVVHRSNKFYWDASQGINREANVPELEAPKLSRLCKGLYKSISHGYLLYLNAQFKMPRRSDFSKLAFFTAIAPDRRAMIRHVSVFWGSSAPKMFTLLISIKKLETLELRIHPFTAQKWEKKDLTIMKGFTNLALLLQVREVTLDIVLENRTAFMNSPKERADCDKTLALIPGILEALKTYTVKKCDTSEAGIKDRFEKLEHESLLDIHGSARLGLYRKENMVSSRTRSSLRLGVDHLGRAKKPEPKGLYADEVLGCVSVTISKSQLLDLDHPDYIRQGCNVQFEVCHDKTASWYCAERLSSRVLREAILTYYKKELDNGAQGIDQVILLWQNVRKHGNEQIPGKNPGDLRGPMDTSDKFEKREIWNSVWDMLALASITRDLETVKSSHTYPNTAEMPEARLEGGDSTG